MPAPSLSFEFVPPRDIPASFALWEAAQALAPFAPDFVSVTYGAGGSTRELTHETVAALTGQGTEVAAHLTCVKATRDETRAVADRYRALGVRRIVALRGDAPGGGAFQATPGGFASSVELVRDLVDRGFDVTVGAYPDPHPEAGGPGADVDWLKRKVDAGATAAITQFFFEASTFLRFRDACAAAGIGVPILPGLLPVQDWTKARRFAERCGAVVPARLAAGFDTAERDGRARLFALAQATELASTLVSEGVEHLHFYTLNRPDLTRDVVRALGCAERPALSAAA